MWFLKNQKCTEIENRLWYRKHYLPWSKNMVNCSTQNQRICIIRNFSSKNQVMETRVVHVAFAKNTLQMLASLIFNEFVKGFYIYVFMCMCMYMYVCMYIYIYM